MEDQREVRRGGGEMIWKLLKYWYQQIILGDEGIFKP